MNNNPRCLYDNGFDKFINEEANAILGELCDRYHGNALTTTIEAWKNEILLDKYLIWYSMVERIGLPSGTTPNRFFEQSNRKFGEIYAKYQICKF